MGSGSGIVLLPNGTRANVDPFYNYKIPDQEDLPPGWEARIIGPNDAIYLCKKRKLHVVLSIITPDNWVGQWVHVSYSHPHRTPNHNITMVVKKLFVGENREALSIYPPASRYVNTHEHCLHLWSPLDPRDRMWPKFEHEIDGVLQI